MYSNFERQFSMSHTIMCVDDDISILEVVKDCLTDFFGYDIIIAHGGLKAVERYKELWNEIDIVILDMMMPDLNGCQVYDELIKVNPKVKVIVMSGYCSNEMLAKMTAHGCSFLQKPVNMDILHQTISNTISQVTYENA